MDGLSFLYQHFFHFLRVRQIDVLLGLCGDKTCYAVLPVQIVAVVEVGYRHHGYR